MPENARIIYLLSSEQPVASADVLALTRRLTAKGHSVLVAGPLSRVQQEQVVMAGGRWVNLPLGPFSDPVKRQTSAQQLRRLLVSNEFDILHAYGLAAAATASAAVHRLRPRPRLVATLGDLTSHLLGRRDSRQVRTLLDRCDGLMVTAFSEQQALQDLDPKAARQARLIYSSTELRPITADFDLGRKRRSLGVRPETAVLGIISPAVASLGLDTVLEAATVTNRDFPNVEFLFIGDGPDQPDLVLKAHQLGISGACVFRGDRADITEIIACLNILLIPSEVPGSLAYALQALSHEIPVIATPTPALREVLEKVDPDALIDMTDPAGVAAAIAQRLEILPPPDEDLYAEMGLNLKYGDMLVSGAGFDLDQAGLEAQWRGDESDMQRIVRDAQARYSSHKMAEAVWAFYQELL